MDKQGSGSRPRRFSFRVFGLIGLLMPGASGAANWLSPEQLIGDEDGFCHPVFEAGQGTQNQCKACADDINQHLHQGERLPLLEQLKRFDCGYIGTPVEEARRSGWSLFIDQDLLTFDSYTDLNEDRNYTMGVGFARSGADFSQGWLADTRHWLDRRWSLHTGPNPVESIHTEEFGLTAFTPNDLENEAPIPGDRPYASLVYWSNSRVTAYTDDHAVRSRFVLGILGLELAPEIQRFLHNDLDFSGKDPRGWDNQISDGGEPTALYSVERVQRLGYDYVGKVESDFSTTLSANLGYYIDAAFGFDWRFGARVRSPYYSHSANPLSVVNHNFCVNCQTDDNYFFLGYRMRLVGYNALLQGAFRDNEHEFHASDIERLLHEVSLGWSWQFGKDNQWRLTYALSFKSSEYKGNESRDHWFGGLYLTRNGMAED